jgi:hypothetical protein
MSCGWFVDGLGIIVRQRGRCQQNPASHFSARTWHYRPPDFSHKKQRIRAVRVLQGREEFSVKSLHFLIGCRNISKKIGKYVLFVRFIKTS